MAVTKDAQSLYQDVLHRTESDPDVLKGWQNYIDEHGYDATLALFRTTVAKYVLSDEQEYAMDYDRIANTGETGQRTTALSDMYDEVMQKAMAANESLLSGQLDDQTVAMLFSKAAERGLQAGVGSSSQFAENIGLRDLGLTAESVKQQGIANATAIAESLRAMTETQQNYQAQITSLIQSERKIGASEEEIRLNADVANRQISSTVNNAINENVMNMYELLGKFEEAGVSGSMVNAAGQTLAEQLSVSAEAVRQDLSAFADKVRR